MSENIKILLNSQKLPDSVNDLTQVQIGIQNSNKPLPLNNIDTTVSQYEQFLKERKESTLYRLYGVVSPIISNPLFNDNVKIFRDFNNNIVSKKILSSSIFEKNGWIGYYNDELDENSLQTNDNKSALCDFFPFDPGYDKLKMLDTDGIPNYLLRVVYPFSKKDIVLVKNNSNISLKDGIPIIEKFLIKINGRNYTGFKTCINHGLNVDDKISLINFIDNTPNNTLNFSVNYRVFKLGNETNDLKFRYFVLDVEPGDIDITKGVSTIKRVVNDVRSEYYVRQFKTITSFDYKDYDIYPAAFGTTIFGDQVVAFNFKIDINVNELKDNLGRPLSELYFSIMKNDNDSDINTDNNQYWLDLQSNLPTPNNTRFWTKISGGYLTENDDNINYNIRSYGDVSYNGSLYYENIDESDELFDGDIVEYNETILLEKRLEDVYHRFNTVYRENLHSIYGSLEDKKEGYIYNPFNKIKIREFRNVMNPILDMNLILNKYNITNPEDIKKLRKSLKIPDYAKEISPNIFKWRELMEIGEVDSTGNGVNYPFESGCHYIYINKRFYLQRQDPPCEFTITSNDITLGFGYSNGDFETYITDPTFLKYEFNEEISDSLIPSGGVLDISSYNGLTPLNLTVNLVDYVGEYELGKRDIPGGCVDFSIIKRNDLDEVC